jgi:uncharacterized membrane protein
MPTAGTLEFVPADQVENAEMTVEEAMRMLISGGILAPERSPTAAERKELDGQEQDSSSKQGSE